MRNSEWETADYRKGYRPEVVTDVVSRETIILVSPFHVKHPFCHDSLRGRLTAIVSRETRSALSQGSSCPFWKREFRSQKLDFRVLGNDETYGMPKSEFRFHSSGLKSNPLSSFG